MALINQDVTLDFAIKKYKTGVCRMIKHLDLNENADILIK